ncbi:MAG: gliding motility-associated C-terminal domain-containing protein, partial [Saprospiraceae bacterium]|nr:gliding motility-associated C-terminal domain-containing protein [Saprospiraceae bacterium]
SLVCADVVDVQISDNSIGTTDSSIWSYQVTSDKGLDITLEGPNPSFRVDGSQKLTISQTVIVSSTCTVNKSEMLTIDVKDTGVKDGDTITVCAGSSVVLGTGNDSCYTYRWSPEESLDFADIANPIATPEMSTTYTVVISDPINNCRITKTVHVEIIPNTEVTVDFRVEKECDSQTVMFINESTGSDNFIWEFGDPRFPDSTSTERDPVHTYPSEGGNFIAVLTIPGDACNAVRTKRLPIVGNDIEDDFSDTIRVCGPSVVELNPDRNRFLIYQWEDNPLIPDPTIANPDIFLADDATFQVTITDPLNTTCMYSGEVVVLVDSQLVVENCDRALFVCVPGPVELNPGGDPDLIYMWTPIFDLDDPTSHNPTANITEETTFIASITDPNDASCTIRCRVRVSIGLDDTGTFGDSDTLFICDSSSFFLNPGANPNLVYEWSPAEGLDDPTSPNPIASPTQSTTYSVTITDTSGTCDTTKIGRIEIIQSDVKVDFEVEKECDSLRVQFINTSMNAESFIWTFGDPTNPGFVSNEVSPTYTYPMGNATYEVELRSSDDENCSARRAMRITLTGEDFVDFSDTIRICGPSLVDLNPDRNQNYNYCWEAHPAIADTNAANPRVDLEDTTIFKVIVKDPLNDTCTIMGEVVVFVDDQINPNLPDTVVNCVPGPVELNPDGDSNLIYMWEPAGLLDDPTSFNPTADVTGSAVFSVTVTDPNDSTCIVQAEVNVFIGESIPLITTDSMNMLCPGDSVALTANSGLVDSLIWTDPDGTVLGTGTPLIIAVEKSGYYKVTGLKDDCEYVDSVFLGVRELMFSLDKELPSCPDEPVEITVTNNTDFVIDSIIWKPDSIIAIGQGSETVVVRPSQTTTVVAMVIFEDGCMTQDSITISVSDLDRFGAMADPDTILFGEETTLIATQEEGATYQWTPSDIVQNPNASTTIATPPQSTTFTVDITDMNGCSTSIDVPVEVIMIMCEPPTIFLPNAFSPNGDGANDVWQLRHPEINRDYILEMDLFVYNRWGQLVFESHSPDMGWDGTFKGELLSPDVYGYYLRIVCVDGDSFSDKGNVSLLH